MTDRPWMPLYVADFIADTLDLDAEQIGAYMLLLMLAWRRDGTLPDDFKAIRSMLGRCTSNMHGNRFNRLVPPLIHRFFYRDEDGNWTQKRLRKELENARKISGKNREKAEKRWAKTKKNNGIADAGADAAAMLITTTTTNSEPNGSGAAAPLSAVDPKTILFRDGLVELSRLSGKTIPSLRPLLGRWLQKSGDDATAILQLIDRCTETKRADPVGWIEACLRPRGQAPPQRSALMVAAEKWLMEDDGGKDSEGGPFGHVELFPSKQS